MPKVGGEKFSYTPEGQRLAAKARLKKKMKGGGPVYRKKGSSKKGESKKTNPRYPVAEMNQTSMKGAVEALTEALQGESLDPFQVQEPDPASRTKAKVGTRKKKKMKGGGPVRRMSKGGKLVKGPNS